MDKLQMQSKNLVDENIEFIAKRFPNCVTEALDEEGKLTKLVDFDMLKQELSHAVIDGDKERYTMTWPDKKQAILTANAPIAKTLRPCINESVDFDSTQNLYIEGDNLDVLKLLRETYLGKIKMIYIDPPYNTGNDFVYNDDFAVDTEEYLERSNQFDEQGNRMVVNNDSNGRFHTDWLNMIYPRLKLAKDLLTDDGVIFISMADTELANQLKICEEIFGKNNIELFVWKKKGGAGNTEKIIGVLTEYIICCFKSKKPYDLNFQTFERIYKFSDNKGPYNLEGIEKTNLGGYERKTMQFAITDPETKQQFYPSENMRWTIGENTAIELLNDHKLFFDYKTNKVKRIKRPEDYELSENVYYNLLTEEGSLATAKDECLALLGNREYFDTPKPTLLIKKLLKIASKENSLILDFFSGSATTAHAVMQLNAEDGGNRKYIMVQLPEVCDEKSEAYKAGYKTICEIGKERIRRAGLMIASKLAGKDFERRENEIKEAFSNTNDVIKTIDNMRLNKTGENRDYKCPIDTGFRDLKLDSSCMKDIYYSPNKTTQDLLTQFEDNIKEDRTPEDLLFQVMLDMGVLLSSEIKTLEINGKKVFNVNDGNLVCCFDKNINDDVVTAIAKMQPLYAVFRDASMSTDSVSVNFDQIFETYSPTTIRKVI